LTGQCKNNTPNDKIRSKSKQEVEFQYGGRLFSETGNTYDLPSNVKESFKKILDLFLDPDPEADDFQNLIKLFLVYTDTSLVKIS